MTVSPGTAIFELIDGTYVEWYVVDVQMTPDHPRSHAVAILSNGRERATADADRLDDAVADGDNPRWVPSLYDGEGPDGAEWVPHPRRADPDASLGDVDVRLRTAPESPSDLTFEKIEGRGSRTEVNNFLEGAEDGLVSHDLGGVSSWKAAFVARHDGAIVSALTMHHYHPSTNGVEIAITRVANHPSAPKNTSTWVIARARKWAERAGYERVATYAGVGGNEGVCYRAAGFDAVGEPVEVDGKNWTSDHHGAADEDSTWLKQKYVYELAPEKYADKGPEWAVESIADGVLVPGRSGLSASSGRGAGVAAAD